MKSLLFGFKPIVFLDGNDINWTNDSEYAGSWSRVSESTSEREPIVEFISQMGWTSVFAGHIETSIPKDLQCDD